MDDETKAKLASFLTARPIMVMSRTICRNWEGIEVTLGMDEAGNGPSVVLLPALSSVSTRMEMSSLFEKLAPMFLSQRRRPARLWRSGAATKRLVAGDPICIPQLVLERDRVAAPCDRRRWT
jgi:hypothetical protein